MAYIWINPVTAGMYEPKDLDEFLSRNGYKRFEVSGDWLSVVREKYQSAVEKAETTVVDMRCPRVKNLLEEILVLPEVTVPDIKPILIHCGKESSRREDLKGEEKIITTPCQALADMGNAMQLKDTRFIPWNRFVAETGGKLQRIPLTKSPIPPGFFEGVGLKTASVTGESRIIEYFRQGVPDDVQLVEMLFCKDGCHNGDGIRECEHE